MLTQSSHLQTETKATGFALLASLSQNGTASGTGYNVGFIVGLEPEYITDEHAQDDGASYPVQTDGDWFDFSVSENTFTGSAGSGGHTGEEHLKQVTILGVSPKPEKVEWNGK